MGTLGIFEVCSKFDLSLLLWYASTPN